jgi:hypothetical protein
MGLRGIYSSLVGMSPLLIGMVALELTVFLIAAAAAAIIVIALSPCPSCTGLYPLYLIPPSRSLLLALFALSPSSVVAPAVRADTESLLVVWDCPIMERF